MESRGVCRRGKRVTTLGNPGGKIAEDLVNRDFSAREPNKLWVADITYIPTLAGVLYLGIVLDVFSRRVIGWAMAAHMKTELVLSALEMALAQRSVDEVIHHTDKGSQYTSLAFGLRCKEAGIRLSMGSVGDCYDNALCESFFASLECELIDRATFKNRMDAEMQIFDFIEGWYNPHRRHSAIGYLSPINYERQHLTQTKNQTKNSPRKRGNFNENIYCLWRLCLLPLAFVVDSDCVVAVVVFSYLVLSYSFTDAGTRPSPRKPHVIISRF